MAGNPAKYHGVNAQVLKQNDKQPLDDRTIRHIMNAYYLIYQTSYSLEDATEKIIEQVPPGPQIDAIIEFVKQSKGITK
jgi:UDP-N-acetylglucosamine acyltransferase